MRNKYPPPIPFRPSGHAKRRMQQRAIRPSDIESALDWGRANKQSRGICRYTVGHRDVARAKREQVDISHCLGLTVVATDRGCVITAWWDRPAHHSHLPIAHRIRSRALQSRVNQ